MNDDTISRQAAIEICDWYEQEFPECEYMVRLMAKDLQDLPSSERRGRWVLQEYMSEIDSFIYTEYKCSNCGEISKKKSNYCSNCDARMEASE